MKDKADHVTRADVNSYKLRVLDGSGLLGEVINMKRDMHEGLVQPRPLDKRLVAENIPHFDVYNKGSAPSGARRPCP
jgi:hypothetical protein